MTRVGKFITRIAASICTSAISQGILLWLATKGIYPANWIAILLGYTEDKPWIWYAIVALFGLLGLLFGPSLGEVFMGWRDKYRRKGRNIENVAPHGTGIVITGDSDVTIGELISTDNAGAGLWSDDRAKVRVGNARMARNGRTKKDSPPE